MKIFSYLKSLFKVNLNSNVQSLPTTVQTYNTYDVFGNGLQSGDFVIVAKYNELKRRGYVTILNNVDAVKYAFKPNDKNIYIKLDAFEKLSKTNSKRHGYMHVSY